MLAALMALLIAMLPGPTAQQAPERAASLGLPVATLSALNGRAQVLRQDVVQVQPVAGLPPSAFALPRAPQTWQLAGRPRPRALPHPSWRTAPLARGPPRPS